jgi:hypothetical protein
MELELLFEITAASGADWFLIVPTASWHHRRAPRAEN